MPLMVDLRSESYKKLREKNTRSTPTAPNISSGGVTSGGGSSSTSTQQEEPVFTAEQYYKDTHSIDTTSSTIEPVKNKEGQIVGVTDTVGKQSIVFNRPITSTEFKDIQETQIAHEEVTAIAKANPQIQQPTQVTPVNLNVSQAELLTSGLRINTLIPQKTPFKANVTPQSKITQQRAELVGYQTEKEQLDQVSAEERKRLQEALNIANFITKGSQEIIKKAPRVPMETFDYFRSREGMKTTGIVAGSALLLATPYPDEWLVGGGLLAKGGFYGLQFLKGRAIVGATKEVAKINAPQKYKDFYKQEAFNPSMSQNYNKEAEAIQSQGFVRNTLYNINQLMSNKKDVFAESARQQAISLGYKGEQINDFVDASLYMRTWSGAGEAFALFEVSRNVENYGRRRIAGAFERAGEKGVSWAKGKGFMQVAKLMTPSLIEAGYIEASSQQFAQYSARYSDMPLFDKEDFKPENLVNFLPFGRTVKDFIKGEKTQPQSQVGGSLEMGSYGSLSATLLGVPIGYLGTAERKASQYSLEFIGSMGDWFEKPADWAQDFSEYLGYNVFGKKISQASVKVLKSGRVVPTMTYYGAKNLPVHILTPTLSGSTPAVTESPSMVRSPQPTPTEVKKPRSTASQFVQNFIGVNTNIDTTTPTPINKNTATPANIFTTTPSDTTTPSPSNTPTDTNTPTPSDTNTPTPTDTNTPNDTNTPSNTNTNTNTEINNLVGVPVYTPVIRAPAPLPFLFPDFSGGSGAGSKKGKSKKYIAELAYSRMALTDMLPEFAPPQAKGKKPSKTGFSFFPNFPSPQRAKVKRTTKKKRGKKKQKSNKARATPFNPLPTYLRSLLGF